MTDSNKQSLSPRDSEYPVVYQRADDEISLFDLWLVLMRRRLWIVGIFILSMLGGVAAWQTKTPGQKVLTTIEIGTVHESGSLAGIEEREAVASRLRDGGVPLVRQQLAAELGLSLGEIPRVTVRLPDKETPGAFVFLESTVPLERVETAERVHGELVAFLQAAHERPLAIGRSTYEAQLADLRRRYEAVADERVFRLRELGAAEEIAAAQASLAALRENFPSQRRQREAELTRQEDALQALRAAFVIEEQAFQHRIRRAEANNQTLQEHRERLMARLGRLEVEGDLLQDELADLQEWLQTTRQGQLQLAQGRMQESALVGTMMMGNLSEDVRRERSRAQQELLVKLPERHAALEAQLAENLLEIQTGEERVLELQAGLAKFREDHVRTVRTAELEIAGLREELALLQARHAREVEQLERQLQRHQADKVKLFADHERERDAVRQELARFEALGQRLVPTEAIAVAVPSELTGRGGGLILALSAVLGLMLGVFGAFFAEFAARARALEQRQELL